MYELLNEDYIHGGTQKDFYGEKDKETCPCPFCQSSQFVKLGDERGLSVVKCQECALIYTNPRAKDSEQNYFGSAAVFYSEARLVFKGKKSHHRDKNYLFELKQIKKIKNGGRLLDIGSNMGFFLRKAKEVGFEVEGIEPSPALAEIARKEWGLKIHNDFLEEANLPEKDFDVITLIDVLEHVTNPKQLLSSCRKLLKDDGIIAIKVPNGDYNEFKMQLGRRFQKSIKMDFWNCCEHVIHYSPPTFKAMIESCGFTIKSFFVPLPIHPPIWANLVGHYYQYPSPFVLDWKRRTLRTLFYWIGRMEKLLGTKIRFGPDLMFIIEKKN